MRFRSSHIQRTIFQRVTDALGTLGWTADPVNFGTSPVVLIEGQGWEELPTDQIAPNTLTVTLAGELADEIEELGGGLYSREYPLHVDCFGETGQMAWRVLEDLKPVLHEAVFPVLNWNGSAPVETDEELEIDVLGIDQPARGEAGSEEMRRRWKLMSCTVTVYFREA